MSVSESKEETLGKMMKIYVSQVLLDKGVWSIQEQGLNLITEFLIKMIRLVGSKAQKIYEHQGRQEGSIFHVLLALDHMRVKPNEILSHLNEIKQNPANPDQGHLNRLLNSLMEQIFKEKYGQVEEEYVNNIRNPKNTIKIDQMYDPSFGAGQRTFLDTLQVPVHFRDEIAPKEKKEITEKELKETKRQFMLNGEDDEFQRRKNQLMDLNKKKRIAENEDINEYREANLFNTVIKKVKNIEEVKSLLK